MPRELQACGVFLARADVVGRRRRMCSPDQDSQEKESSWL